MLVSFVRLYVKDFETIGESDLNFRLQAKRDCSSINEQRNTKNYLDSNSGIMSEIVR